MLIGLVAYASSILVGGIAATRASKQVEALVADHQTSDPVVASAVRRVWTFARIDLVILSTALWAMTWKPG